MAQIGIEVKKDDDFSTWYTQVPLKLVKFKKKSPFVEFNSIEKSILGFKTFGNVRIL